MTRSRARGLVRIAAMVASSVAVCALPAPAEAQSRLLCFRPAPLDACRSFVLFEVRGQSPLLHPTRYRFVTISREQQRPDGTFGMTVDTLVDKELSHSLGWEAGWAANVSRRWAVGGVLGLELADESRRHTAALRVRRWLTDDVAIELAPGLFRLIATGGGGGLETGGERDAARIGGNGALRVLLWDVAVLALRYDVLPIEERRWQQYGAEFFDPGGVERNWAIGAGLESRTGLIASLAGALVLAGIILSVGLPAT